MAIIWLGLKKESLEDKTRNFFILLIKIRQFDKY
jgi:hypothetical protein